MKFTTIFTATLAAFASAAPAPIAQEPAELPALETRNIDISGLNGLRGFQQVDLNYLLRLNQVDLNIFNQLGQVNNLNLIAFQHLFNAQQFDLHALLQLQQLNTIINFQRQGLFNNLDLARLQLGGLNLGLIQNLHGVNLGGFIGRDVVPQIELIAGQPSKSHPFRTSARSQALTSISSANNIILGK